jgi:hypothetical protein
MNPIFQHICDIPFDYGRVIAVTTYEGMIVACTDRGNVLTIENDRYSGIWRAREVTPMPNPI